MDSFIQVLSFGVSFLYGLLFYLLTRFNYFILEKKNNIIKFLVTLVFIIDIVILYVYLLYKINNGYFHIYFIIVVIIGFGIINKFYDKFKNTCKKYVKKIKKK